MPPALSRNPQVAKDNLDRLKQQVAERDKEIYILKQDVIALRAGVQDSMQMLRDTSEGFSPTQRISRANAWLLLLLGNHLPSATVTPKKLR